MGARISLWRSCAQNTFCKLRNAPQTADETSLWDNVAGRLTAKLKGGRCRVEAAVLSPAKQHLATCAEAGSFLGIRVRQVGAVYAVGEKSVIGRIATGKRGPQG
jgi:hypothetical protein